MQVHIHLQHMRWILATSLHLQNDACDPDPFSFAREEACSWYKNGLPMHCIGTPRSAPILPSHCHLLYIKFTFKFLARLTFTAHCS